MILECPLLETHLLCWRSCTNTGQTECQSIKTAAVETEVHSGFEVLHTLNIGDTITLFAQLTAALQVRTLCRLCDDFVFDSTSK